MSQYCQICGKITNCTDNCIICLEEEQVDTLSKELYEDLLLEQQEQM
jgi:hypothetical protein